MELLLVTVGAVTLFNILKKKESFEETYFDSESYYKTADNQKETNVFSPSESQDKQWTSFKAANDLPDISPYSVTNSDNYLVTGNQSDWIQENSLYNKNLINGIPIKDYYEQYSKDVLENGNWYLNKNMPQETKQYQDDSVIQRRMELATGLLQKRDRITLGKPNKVESFNLFTPEEKTTSYGYQFGQSGQSGPGLSVTRQKEIEDLEKRIKFKTNEQPFEKIQVGRGLALGSEVPAAGGFQQYARIMPDNISDYKANQLPGRVAGGKWVYSNAPTSQQPVLKNRPNGYYSLCQRGPATGKATLTAETVRPDFSVLLKNQNRQTVNYGFGVPTQNLDSFLCSN